jgi:hypothetical protein
MSVSFVVKRVFSDQARLLITTDDDDFLSTLSADAVRKYFVKETRWTKRIKSPGKKRGHPGEPRKRGRFGQKLGKNKRKELYTRQVENPQGRLGQKRVSRWTETRKGGPGKRGNETNNCVQHDRFCS